MAANFSGTNPILSNAVYTAANSVSVLVCLLAAILVFCLKLYKTLVYRLALYQVLSALAMALVGTMQVMFINYEKSPNIYGYVCTAIGWMLAYTAWVNFLFTVWVTFHLFCFAVLHKNLKKLEVLYVVTSLLVPAVIAIIPLITHSYGLDSKVTLCFIYANTSVAFIERLALFDGPAMLMLSVASIAMVVMVIKLAGQVFRRSKYEPITDSDQFWKALKQLLPLAAFPILSFIVRIPVFIFHVNSTQHSTPNDGMAIADDLSASLWLMASGATVVIHISVARICGRKHKSVKPVNILDSRLLFTQHVATGWHPKSETHFSLSPPSV